MSRRQLGQLPGPFGANTPRQDDEPHRRLPAELSAILRALGVLSFASPRIARPERLETLDPVGAVRISYGFKE